MKKIIYTFFIILFLPFYVYAYSQYIIPGGESIGININSDGLIVVGYYKVNNEYINKNIKISDRIIKVNDKYVYTISDINMLKELVDNEKCQEFLQKSLVYSKNKESKPRNNI